MASSETLSDETGSQIFKMAAEKTKLNVAQFLYTIATKFQPPKTVSCADKGEIKDGCH